MTAVIDLRKLAVAHPEPEADPMSQTIGLLRPLFMTTTSIVLFAHILGVLGLFFALAVEWISVELLRSSSGPTPPALSVRFLRLLPRLTGGAVVLILVSGGRMAAQFGVLGAPWVGVSLVAMVLMGALGGTAVRPLVRSLSQRSRPDTTKGWREQASHPFLRVSFGMRLAVALAIVYVMVAKPDLFISSALIASALALGAIGSVGLRRPGRSNMSRRLDPEPER